MHKTKSIMKNNHDFSSSQDLSLSVEARSSPKKDSSYKIKRSVSESSLSNSSFHALSPPVVTLFKPKSENIITVSKLVVKDDRKIADYNAQHHGIKRASTKIIELEEEKRNKTDIKRTTTKQETLAKLAEEADDVSLSLISRWMH